MVPRPRGATLNRRATSSRRASSRTTGSKTIGSNRLRPRGHSCAKTTGAKGGRPARWIANSRGRLFRNRLIQNRIVHPVPHRRDPDPADLDPVTIGSNLPAQNVRLIGEAIGEVIAERIGERAVRRAVVRRQHPKAGREATGRQNVLSENARKKAGKIPSFGNLSGQAMRVYIGLSHLFQRWSQTAAPFFHHRHPKYVEGFRPQILLVRSPEILVERKEGVGFQLPEDAPQFLLNPIDLVEEITPIHLQLPAAELPVRTEEEMKLEKLILGRIEKAFADQTEIGYIFFILSAPDLAAIPPADDCEPRLADMFFFLDAIPESGIAEPEYIP